VLALDLGLRNFLASSEGDVRGINFVDTLRRYATSLRPADSGRPARLAEGRCRAIRGVPSLPRAYQAVASQGPANLILNIIDSSRLAVLAALKAEVLRPGMNSMRLLPMSCDAVFVLVAFVLMRRTARSRGFRDRTGSQQSAKSKE
jgi:hypothetical protein